MKRLNDLSSIITVLTITFCNTIYVPADQPTIQSGLDAAMAGDAVIVASGFYVENITWPNTASISLIGSGVENCIIDGNNNASVVRFEEDLGGIIDNSTLITGFTIQAGNAINDWPGNYGGGLYCKSASPRIVDVTFNNNSTNSDGGGMYLEGSNAILENVIVTGNTASNIGGGIYCNQSSPLLLNVEVIDNSSYSGSGIFCFVSSNPILENVIIHGNSCILEGGGLSCLGSSNPSLTNVLITENSAGQGGGVFCWQSSHPNLNNVTITGNTASKGAGIFSLATSSSPTLVNVTIFDNTAWDFGGGIACDNSSALIVNSILWGNTPNEVSIINSSEIEINFSDIQNSWEGIGNIDENPLFVDPDNGDYSLQEISPCIDAGTADLDGDGIVDILDIVMTVSFILSVEYNVLADINFDGGVNVFDIIMIINIILEN